MTTPYLALHLLCGSRTRLTILRNMAKSYNQQVAGANTTWRNSRTRRMDNVDGGLSQGYNVERAGTPFEKRTPIWSTFDGEQFRHEMKIHEIPRAGVRHNGWYSDADCSETICGIVARLTHGRWIAGYYSSENGERVYLSRVFDEMDDAVQEADDEAQRVAEEEKEYSERYREASDLDYEIEQAGRNVARMFKLRHTDGFDSAADYRELEDGIAALRKLKNKRAEYSDIEG